MSRQESMPLYGKQAQVFVTETCDLSCTGCPYPLQSTEVKIAKHKSEISPEKWLEVNNYLYYLGIRLSCIMGGEPGSFSGLPQVIADIVAHPDAFVLLSTSGKHLRRRHQMRQSVGEALASPRTGGFHNGIAVSFDGIPGYDVDGAETSREQKAREGLEFINLMQNEFGNNITYIGNVMVTPGNIDQVLSIQQFLDERGVYTNLCTKQGKCFGDEHAVFDQSYIPKLSEIAAEMLKRKVDGDRVVNSAAYLSQLPGLIGFEDYHCWDEAQGNPVIDVAPDGKFRYCNWIGQSDEGGPPGIGFDKIHSGEVAWDEFWAQSKSETAMKCRGCSWSRRDRGMVPMVGFNPDIMKLAGISTFSPEDLRLQNIWVQAQCAAMVS